MASLATLPALVTRALSQAEPRGAHPTDARIIDATVAELAESGLSRLAVESVASRAGTSRMTVYRRFGDRDRLIEATIGRETARFLAAVAAADDPAAHPVDRIAAAFATALVEVRGHPFVSRWLEADPGEVLDTLLADDGFVLEAGSAFIAGAIRHGAGRGTKRASGANPDRVAELLIRLFSALVLMPPKSVDLARREQAESLARELIAPIVASGAAARSYA